MRFTASDGYKLLDRFQYPPGDLRLRFAHGRQMSLRNQQRMIAAFHDMEKRWRLHFRADALQKIQRAK